MIDSIRIVDDFCPEIAKVKQSAIDSGFGTWNPSKGEIGSSIYAGMNFWGAHAYMLRSLAIIEGTHVLPNAMFFRVTRPDMEAAYIHSDRDSGARTCIVYLSEHEQEYGTAFYRHVATGLDRMPCMVDMHGKQDYEQLKKDMISSEGWKRAGFVHGAFNRALIFDAPLFHSRIPLTGIGTTDSDSRMVWACHYYTPKTLEI